MTPEEYLEQLTIIGIAVDEDELRQVLQTFD